MRKFWGLVLFGLLFANNALAAVGVEDGQQSTYVCSEQSCSDFITQDDTSITGGQNCAASESLCYVSKPPSGVTGYNYKTTSCTSCPSGYVMDTVTQTSTNARDCVVTYQTCRKQNVCPADCPSQTEYTPAGNGVEKLCVALSGTFSCTARCQEGYYQTWKGRWDFEHDWPGSLRCQKCPANSVHCEPGTEGHSGEIPLTMFECEKNYYRVNKNSSTSSYVNYECQHCPSYASVPTVTAGTGATSVNQCYVPNTQHMRDAAGNEFRFESNCYYTGTYTPGGMVSIYPQPIN